MSQYVRDKKFFLDQIVIYEQEVYGYLITVVDEPQTAEDLVQNTFEKAWKRIGQLKEQRKARSWLFSIARNEANKYFREHHYTVRYMDEIDGIHDDPLATTREDVLELIVRDFDLRTLKQALGMLESKYSRLIIMHYFEGLNQKEIAKVLNQKHGTVRVNLVRALNKVREIKDRIEEGEAL